MDKSKYEVIVVSDGPDAETAAMINQLQANDNIRLLVLPQKKGPAAARNMGWQNAKAPVVVFTDDDCLPDAYWLSNILENTEPNGEQAFTGRVVVPRSERPTDHELNTAGLETADFVTANCACTLKALVKTGGFDEQFSMAWREDSDLEFKLLLNNIPIKKLDKAVVVHPVREAAWGISIKEQKKTLYNALLYQKYPGLYRKKIQPVPPVLYYGIIVSFLMIIAGIIRHSEIFTMVSLLTWAEFTLYFIFKRTYRRNRTIRHVSEMVVTSLVIPFLSIYWHWYGAIKYRVFFI